MIIAFGHKKFVGKDSVAAIIAKQVTAQRISFATPLKQLSYDLYKWTGLQKPAYYEGLPDDKMKLLPKLGMSPRDLWIKVGIFFREINEDTWAYPAIAEAKKHKVAIITDLRFPNEARLLKKAGAILIRIDRPSVKPTDDAADCALDGYDGWDYVLNNNTRTMSGLEKKVKKEILPLILNGG